MYDSCFISWVISVLFPILSASFCLLISNVLRAYILHILTCSYYFLWIPYRNMNWQLRFRCAFTDDDHIIIYLLTFLEINSLSSDMIFKCFIPFLRLLFHSIDDFSLQHDLLIFAFATCAFNVISRKELKRPRHKNFPIFSYQSKVLHLILDFTEFMFMFSRV